MAKAELPRVELVIYEKYPGYPKGNRWKSNDAEIHKRTLCKLVPDLCLKMNLTSLRRLKIIGHYSRNEWIELLDELSGLDGPHHNLSVLEIGTLTFYEGDSITCALPGLRFLSIDRVLVVDPNEKEQVVFEGYWTSVSILFDTPSLRIVYLGK